MRQLADFMNSAKLSAALLLLAIASHSLTAAERPTFYRDIAAIIHQHCGDCHRPGGAGPFALLTLHDVACHAADIQRVLRSGEMPPWKPIGKQGEFVGDQRLSDDEKRLVERWITDGAPAGERMELRIPRLAAGQWQLGEPDVLLQPAGLGWRAPANILAADLEQRDDLWVTAIELRPRQSGLQHALIWLDLPVTSQVLETDNAGQQVHRQLLPTWLRDRLLAPAP